MNQPIASRTVPIRIAFCITELGPGGAERCLVELVKRLDRAQFDPVVYCLAPRPADNGTSLATELEQTGVTVHFFGARHVIDFPWILVKVRRQMRADQPLVVQGFLFHANFVATLGARACGVPHVLTGIRVAERRGHGHLTLARWTDRWVERHVCVSQGVQEFSRTRGGLPQEKLIVIPNGVDLARFKDVPQCPAASLSVANDRRLIVHVGRLDPQKGISWLLEIMPRVFAELPRHDLLIVGSGPNRETLEQLAARLGVAERVHFTGFRRDVPAILAASDALVLASRWEGMPNVVLEAMAAAKPVVSTDVEGVAEALGPGADAQVAPRNQPELFAHKLLVILKSSAFSAELGAQNRQRAEQFFSLESMTAAYGELYRSLATPKS